MSKKEQGTVKNSPNSAKKVLLIGITVVASLIILLLLASWTLDAFDKDKAPATSNDVELDYEFYPANFDEDIFEDPEYIELTENGFISYCNAGGNTTVGIERDSAHEYGESVAFMVELLYDVIEGNNDEYNARFSDKYYESNSPVGVFTMQKIYDVTITRISEEAVSENGNNYTKFLYSLEYKILHNNGTFRKDIGDGSRKQYFTVTDRPGKFAIDSVSVINVK